MCLSRIKRIISSYLGKCLWGRCERKYSVDIIKSVGNGDEHRVWYEATPIHHLLFIKKYIKKHGLNTSDKVMDVGCGKGAMLWYFFHEIGFAKVAGIEYSEELYKICRNNTEKWNINADVINVDATKYDKYDDYNYFYLFNPFDEVIMEQFVLKLEASIKRKPRATTILYVCCAHRRVFEKYGWKSVSEYKKNIFHSKESVVLYKSEKGD